MKLFLSCLIFGTVSHAAPATTDLTKLYLRYIKLVTALDVDPTYAKLRAEETALHQAHQDGDAAQAELAQSRYVPLQQHILKLYANDFANLAADFGRAYPEAVASTSATGTRVTFKAHHALARAFDLDPFGVGHPWDPFTYTGPADQSFLDHAHAFIGASAFTLLDSVLIQLKADPDYQALVTYANTFRDLPPQLEPRYQPLFEALNYAFRRRDDQAMTRIVSVQPRSTRAPGFLIQDSLDNLLNFHEAKRHLSLVIDMLGEFAREHAETCLVDLAGHP